MRILLKLLLTGLLLVLAVAVGTEVAALHHFSLPDPSRAPQAVIVRKAAYPASLPKTVRAVPRRPGNWPARHKLPSTLHKKPLAG